MAMRVIKRADLVAQMNEALSAKWINMTFHGIFVPVIYAWYTWHSKL